MEETLSMKAHMLKKAAAGGIPVYAAYFCGIYFSWFNLWHLYECVWLQLLVSDDHECDYFAGSAEFVAANMLLGAFNPIQALTMTLMINARHLFYGISMLDKFRGTGLKKVYLIFGMCDETFSINCTARLPDSVDRGWFMFFVTLYNHLYWFFGATLGGIFGSYIHFNTEGLDFVMTAMFVVIFMEQWLKEKRHFSSLMGLGLSLLC